MKNQSHRWSSKVVKMLFYCACVISGIYLFFILPETKEYFGISVMIASIGFSLYLFFIGYMLLNSGFKINAAERIIKEVEYKQAMQLATKSEG